MRIKELEDAIVSTEKKRLLIFMGVVVVGIAILIVNILFLAATFSQYFKDPRSLTIGIWVNFALLFFLLIARLYVNQISKKGKTLPYRYTTSIVLVEVFVPIIWLFFIIRSEQTAVFLDSPLNFIYFLFLIVSSLQMSFWLSVFSGFLTGVVYSVISYWALSSFPETAGFPDMVYYSKAMLFIVAGVCAGLVASEIKKRLSISIITKRERDRIETLFSQQVSREVVDSLKSQRDFGVKGEATIMFLDIRNFTSRIQYLPPEEINRFQNQIFNPLLECVSQNGGVVHQILGDGFMVSYGEGEEEKAFHTATDILRKLSIMNKSKNNPVAVGIGVHTGEVVAGNIGNADRKQFSISGLAVVIAARLEQLTKDYECSWLVSDSFYKKIAHLSLKSSSLGQVKLKGIDEEVELIKMC